MKPTWGNIAQWIEGDLAARDNVMAVVALIAYIISLTVIGTIQATTAVVRYGYRKLRGEL